MALTFDHTSSLIGVPQLDAAPLLIQSLVNAIREEEASERGIVYDQILDASGKEDLGGGVYTGITAGLRSSWKLNFAAGAYQASIDGGNLADALSRVNNTGSPQVLVLASAAATVVATGSGVLPSDVTNIAAAVWADADGRFVARFGRNKFITDPATGIATLYDDDGVTVLAQGQLYEDAAGSVPYRGQGAERRERLA